MNKYKQFAKLCYKKIVIFLSKLWAMLFQPRKNFYDKTVHVEKSFKFCIAAKGKIVIGSNAHLIDGSISVGNNAELIIGANTVISGRIAIGDNCSMVMGNKNKIHNSTIGIVNQSRIEIGEGVHIRSNGGHQCSINLDNGKLFLAEKVRIESEILVRFGGQLTIGKYTGVGYGSSIRCEERIDIGDYGMISYDTRIWDTNAHSTDWHERRQRIEKGYPMGASEEVRPNTMPVSIGDDIWIGEGATILKGCAIGNRCIVGMRVVVGAGTFDDDSIIVAAKSRIIKRSK